MANSAKTAESKAWPFPTSPRSPYKLQGELRLLKQLEGEVWDSRTQLEFAKLLKNHPEFRGETSLDDPGFSARDRATRAPRLLGFVHFPKRGTRGGFRFTEVGNAFLEASETEQTLIFQRQIAKVQFKSPLHCSGGFKDMNIRPLTAMIKLLLTIEKMSKEEVALFAITLINAREFAERVQEIRKYRHLLGQQTNNIARKRFRRDYADNWVSGIYGDDIKGERVHLREGGRNFLETKTRTLRDYADSTIRYFRSTGLFTITQNGQHLVLSSGNLKDAEFLLERYGIGLSEYTDLGYNEYFSVYLGNPSLPELRKDDSQRQSQDVASMVEKLAGYKSDKAMEFQRKYLEAVSNMEKLQIVNGLEELMISLQIKNETMEIRRNRIASLENIESMYRGIADRQSEILDKPLMYEWNTWRAFVLINDAISVQGNYIADVDGNPVSTAPGNRPDILIEYEKFWLVVEVTLQRGVRQYETESEPIFRHVGIRQKTLVDNGDSRPTFGIFIAEHVRDEVVSYLYVSASANLQRYGGPVRIVPVNKDVFIMLTNSVLQHPNFSHRVLHQFFSNVFTKEALENGEDIWLQHIEEQIKRLPDYKG